MKIGILGAGSWGIAIARLLSQKDIELVVWSIDSEEIAMLNEYHEHKSKLPGVILNKNIVFTTDLETAVLGMDMVVFVVPSPFIRTTAKSIRKFSHQGQIIVNASKGIEDKTYKVLTEVIKDELPNAKVGVLSGPSHAEEVGKGIPTTIVAGAYDKKTAMVIQDTFMSDNFRVYTSPDVIGIDLGGALKNVIALAAGMADGMGCGDNTKAALITRGIYEITKLGMAMGGHQETFAGLSGIGDLIVTCASKHSRNRNAGFLMGQGKSYKEAMDDVKMVVEGVYAAKAALELAKINHVDMPIVEMVNRVIFEGLSTKDAMYELLGRVKTTEVTTIKWSE